ncbi:hypothetical protein D3C78_1198990 [compost metagenome]
MFIQFQGAGTQVVGQVITHGMRGGVRSPQPLHAIAAGLEVQHLVRGGAVALVEVQSRQVADFGGHGACVGQGRADFAQAFAPAAVEVAFGVVVFIFALHWRHAGQLVAHIPAHGLATLQKPQVAVAVEAAGKICRLIILQQAAVAVRIDGPTPSKGLRAEVAQFGHVAGEVIVVFLAVVDHGVGIVRHPVTAAGISGGFFGFPAGSADQLAEAVIAEGA